MLVRTGERREERGGNLGPQDVIDDDMRLGAIGAKRVREPAHVDIGGDEIPKIRQSVRRGFRALLASSGKRWPPKILSVDQNGLA